MSNATVGRTILRLNAGFLGLASLNGLLVLDVAGIVFKRGPEAAILANAPHAGIGFVEAHGLALIIAVLLWLAAPLRVWHYTAVAVMALLGTANLVFWDSFVAADFVTTGYVATTLHWIFAFLQLVAAVRAPGTFTRTQPVATPARG